MEPLASQKRAAALADYARTWDEVLREQLPLGLVVLVGLVLLVWLAYRWQVARRRRPPADLDIDLPLEPPYRR